MDQFELRATTGVALIAFGLGMLVWTVVVFDRVGEGTLAIGSPVKLVVAVLIGMSATR